MTRFPAIVALGAFCLGLPGCTQFPELDAASRERITGDRPAPAIAPIDGIRVEAESFTITAEGTAALQQRAAELQARAAGVPTQSAEPEIVARLTARASCPRGDPACVASAGATR